MNTKSIFFILTVVIIVVGWVIISKQRQTPPQPINQYGATNTGTISTSTDNQLVYSNSSLGLAFNFPLGWHVGDNNLGHGSFQLFNYDETGAVSTSFQKGMNKIELLISTASSSPSELGDYPKESIKSSKVTIGNTEALKQIISLNDTSHQQIVSYYIPIPSKAGQYLVATMFGDSTNFGVLDILVSSIQWPK
jgi:hypothetical protein